MSAGFDPAGFWSLTSRLYLAQMKGASARLEREHKDRGWLAWHTAVLTRAETMPDFSKFVGESPVNPQSPEHLQTMCETLAQAWGAKELQCQNLLLEPCG